MIVSGGGVAAEEPSATPLIAYAARIAGDESRARIVIDFDRKPQFTLHYTAAPARLIVDLDETTFGFGDSDLAPKGLFTDIRYGRMGAGASRLVLTARRPFKAVLAEARENEPGKGFRLILDSEMTSADEFAALVKNQTWDAEKVAGGKTPRVAPAETPQAGPESDAIIIAIDAGHGGIDTGALGASGKTVEKDVTLAFAKTLADQLNAKPGFRAFLTRSDDTFVSLPERVTIARQGKARLFISLHADTLRQKGIRGATVYTISDRASDKLAEGLAERENLSDDIAGLEVKDEPEEVADILIDLTRRETQAFSIQLAEHVVKSFEGQIELINNPLRHAGFRVLQAPDVPSVLLELGFMSNAEDEKLLTSKAWRDKVSTLIADAAVAYFKANGVLRGG
ncbi:N-acetylmuramoyl-L-alanine amidase [Rhizobium sp. SG_E_25_P2]|uniref:N-acetylmuramoyl-L-alanine amidase n=1 Tax=Rhizobium sp. SG_E_25_P2 TaxID=2879942 RepID=UPI0024753C42|nr:N-acetylmuramoyl-L-alanine amidase [Rhizobium sp. SG_E_25_P2]